jgi:acyl carrier protein
MTFEAILEDMGAVIRDVLDNDDLVITAATTAQDVPEWDSLSHVQLVVAMEKRFKVRFTAAEIRSFKNVGEMATAIQQRLS